MCVYVCVFSVVVFVFLFLGGNMVVFCLFYVIVDVWQNFQLGDARVCSCLCFAVLVASHCHECTLPVPSPLVD